MNRIIIILFGLFIVSCNDISITEDDYSVVVIEEYIPMDNYPLVELVRRQEFVSLMMNAGGFYDGENRYMYSWNKKQHYISGNDLEIVFARDRVNEKVGLRPENCLIGAKLFDNKLKAFYILWQNKGIEPIKDSNKTYWSSGYVEYYDKNLDSNIREFNPMKIKYKWEIAEHTDTLVSNLSLNLIKILYPKFTGTYKHVALDTIFLNYELSVETYDFYADIKLKDYELGYSRNYHKLLKYIKNEQKYLP